MYIHEFGSKTEFNGSKFSRVLIAGLVIGSTFGISAANAGEEVNIYSYRQAELIAPVLKLFTEQTGIRTNVLFLKKGLVGPGQG